MNTFLTFDRMTLKSVTHGTTHGKGESILNLGAKL